MASWEIVEKEPDLGALEMDYDLEAFHDQEIAPLVAKLLQLCKAQGIPMLAVFAYARKNDRSHVSTSFVLNGARCPDRFRLARRIVTGEMPERDLPKG